MKQQQAGSKTTHRGLLAVAAGGLVALTVAAGCGGGGTPGGGGGPTAATRARIQEMHQGVFQGIATSGAPVAANFAFVEAGGGGDAAVGAPGAPAFGSGIPNIGAYIHNVVAVPPATRARAISRMTKAGRDHGGETPPSPPIDGGGGGDEFPLPPPSFYFDEYLQLWVQNEYSKTEFRSAFFEDEAKTKPAGNLVSTQPADWNTFPQTYSSRYEFTAGYEAGAHGFYEDTINADYSGTSRYENVSPQYGTSRGRSTRTAAGDFSYSDHTESPDGFTTDSVGTFRHDGSGGTRTSSSDGYATDYTFNADGSGRGTIRGSLPGLPAVITWDPRGNTTIRYADGTIERIPGWGFYGGGGGVGEPVPLDAPVSTDVPPLIK